MRSKALVTSWAPRIVRVKVEPDIDTETVRILATVANTLDTPVSGELHTAVSGWTDPAEAYEPSVLAVDLEAGEERTFDLPSE